MTRLPTLRRPPPKRRTIVLVAFPAVQLLDIAGPADVFASADAMSAETAFEVVVVSAKGGPIATTSGVVIDTLPLDAMSKRQVDTLIVAGGAKQGVVDAIGNPVLAKWVCAVASSARRYGSVCSGAFALAHWGLLDGHRATTHWSAANTLHGHFAKISVEPEALYVHDGRVWTSGGVTAGIDMCLAMVEEDLGRELTARVARQLILSTRRLGNQSQYSQVLELQSGRYAKLIDWVRAHLNEPLGVERLADFVGESSRSFHRHFESETGETPATFVETLRLQVAKEQLEAGASVKAAARAAGLTSDEHLARAFRRRFGMTPLQYQAVHSA
ncbi:MAG: DJ-1/PfpI family protein [Burkholderiaceae bacterium]|nr:DJ-1/PfpI family protein [Burkholderiaceae bacterium]